MSEDEIVADLFCTRLSHKDKEYLRSIEHSDLPKIRASLGDFIKHTYRLNEVGNPHVNANNTSTDMELRIIGRAWAIANDKPIPSLESLQLSVDWCEEYLKHTMFDDYYYYP